MSARDVIVTGYPKSGNTWLSRLVAELLALPAGAFVGDGESEIAGSEPPIPIFRYEDIAQAPRCYIPMIFSHCGVAHVAEAYAHIKPVSIGRYSASLSPAIRRWRFTPLFEQHLRDYGYPVPQSNAIHRAGLTVRMFKENVWRLHESQQAARQKKKN